MDLNLSHTIIGDSMEKRKNEEKVISIKNAVIKKTPQILYWISGVGSQRYPIELIKKGY